MFQPKVVGVMIAAGIAIQRADLFLALSAILWWNGCQLKECGKRAASRCQLISGRRSCESCFEPANCRFVSWPFLESRMLRNQESKQVEVVLMVLGFRGPCLWRHKTAFSGRRCLTALCSRLPNLNLSVSDLHLKARLRMDGRAIYNATVL